MPVMTYNYIHTVTEEMYCQRCIDCGILFAIPKAVDEVLRNSRENFYCPHGHSQHYLAGQSREARRIKELEDANARLLSGRDAAYRYAEIERQRRLGSERSARALKGHLTRMRSRIANGVCPVAGCKRTGFGHSGVERHIQSQHPEWAEQHPDAIV